MNTELLVAYHHAREPCTHASQSADWSPTQTYLPVHIDVSCGAKHCILPRQPTRGLERAHAPHQRRRQSGSVGASNWYAATAKRFEPTKARRNYQTRVFISHPNMDGSEKSTICMRPQSMTCCMCIAVVQCDMQARNRRSSMPTPDLPPTSVKLASSHLMKFKADWRFWRSTDQARSH